MKKDAGKKGINDRKFEGKSIILNKSIGAEYNRMLLYIIEYYGGWVMKT